MSEHDVPAGRGRDELRERLATTLAALVALRDVVRDSGKLNGMEYDELGVEVNRAIEKAEAALLAPQEAPAEGISLSAQLSQAAAWMRVWDECQRLGMDTYGAPSTRTGLDIVLDFIRGHAAPQEAREPDGWAIRMRDGSWRSTIYEDRETAERKAVKAREFFAARGDEDDEFDSIDVLPVYLGAPAKAVTCPCGGGPGHGDAWCGDYECPTCGRGPKLEEAIFQAGLERGRAGAEAVVREAPLVSDTAIRALNAAYDYFTRQYLEHMDAGRAELADIYNGRRVALGEVARALGLDPRTPFPAASAAPTAPGAPEEGAGE